MTKKVIVRKSASSEEPPKLKMPVQGVGKGETKIGVQKVYQLRVDFMMSQGGMYEGESYETVEKELREFVATRWPKSLFTRTGGYYLIESVVEGHREVCLPQDFDFPTMTRKPGTRPPSWATDPNLAASIEREYRVVEESWNPNHLARNAPNLLTTKEVDLKHRLQAEQKLRQAKSVTEQEADKKLDEIAEERPDLIQRPAVKKAAPALNPKKFVRKQ